MKKRIATQKDILIHFTKVLKMEDEKTRYCEANHAADFFVKYYHMLDKPKEEQRRPIVADGRWWNSHRPSWFVDGENFTNAPDVEAPYRVTQEEADLLYDDAIECGNLKLENCPYDPEKYKAYKEMQKAEA